MTTDIEAFARHMTKQTLQGLIAEVRGLLEEDSYLTGRRVLVWMEERLEHLGEAPTVEERSEGDCVNCGRPTALDSQGERLVHLGPDAMLSNRGCRAASYEWRHDQEGGWDETLARSLNARL